MTETGSKEGSISGGVAQGPQGAARALGRGRHWALKGRGRAYCCRISTQGVFGGETRTLGYVAQNPGLGSECKNRYFKPLHISCG